MDVFFSHFLFIFYNNSIQIQKKKIKFKVKKWHWYMYAVSQIYMYQYINFFLLEHLYSMPNMSYSCNDNITKSLFISIY